MSDLLFLTVSDVLEIHGEQIELYGGDNGVRNPALLESALAVPQSGIGGEYFHVDIFDMAAAYLYHIVQNHPFVDGNKRTGLACAYLFLAINGYELECDPDELAEMVLGVAKGGMDKAGSLRSCGYTQSGEVSDHPKILALFASAIKIDENAEDDGQIINAAEQRNMVGYHIIGRDAIQKRSDNQRLFESRQLAVPE